MHTATIIRDASGTPTGINAVASTSLVGGAMATVTGIFSADSLVIPSNMIESAILEAVPAVIGAVIETKLKTGSFAIPFIKTA